LVTTLTTIVAIEFNQQECSNVNETAPGFVGCSPGGLSSSSVTGSAASTQSPASAGTESTSSSTSAPTVDPNSPVATITGAPVFEPATLNGAKPVTATFDGKPLMTGSCTVPYFAIVTDTLGATTEYPEIGCSQDRQACCPYDSFANAVITKCPQDYFTTAGGCCPL